MKSRLGMTSIPLTGGESDSNSFPDFSGWRAMGAAKTVTMPTSTMSTTTSMWPTTQEAKPEVPSKMEVPVDADTSSADKALQAKYYMMKVSTYLSYGALKGITQAIKDGEFRPEDLTNKTKLRNFLSDKSHLMRNLLQKWESSSLSVPLVGGRSAVKTTKELDSLVSSPEAKLWEQAPVKLIEGAPEQTIPYMSAAKVAAWIADKFVTDINVTNALKSMSSELVQERTQTGKQTTFVDLANTIYALYSQQYKMYLGVFLTGTFTGKQEPKGWLDKLTDMFFSKEQQDKHRPAIPEWMAQSVDVANNFGWSDPTLEDKDILPPDVAKALGSRKAFQAKYPKVQQQVAASLSNAALLDSPSLLLSFGALALRKVLEALPSYAQGKSQVEVEAALAYLAQEAFPDSDADQVKVRELIVELHSRKPKGTAVSKEQIDRQVDTLTRQFKELTSAGMKDIPPNTRNIIFKTAFQTVEVGAE